MANETLSARPRLSIYARLEDRAVPVRWAWFRPEPCVGDEVRLPTAHAGDGGWQSFLIIGKRLSTVASSARVIELDVEPLARRD